MNERDKPFLFDQPGSYRITVRGQMSTSWSSRLSDMKITVQDSESQQLVTTLSGELRDQAALMGVLNALHDMHCLVLKVEQISLTLSENDPPSDERKQS
jgi:hypothetical protein